MPVDSFLLGREPMSMLAVRLEQAIPFFGKTGAREQVVRDRLKDDLNDFSQRDTALTASLNAALHRAIGTRVETPETFAVTAPSRSGAELLDMAQRQRPATSFCVALQVAGSHLVDLDGSLAVPHLTEVEVDFAARGRAVESRPT